MDRLMKFKTNVFQATQVLYPESNQKMCLVRLMLEAALKVSKMKLSVATIQILKIDIWQLLVKKYLLNLLEE